VIQPREGCAKEEIAAADATVIRQIKRNAAFEDSGNGRRFHDRGKVGVHNLEIEKFENERKCRI